MALCYHNACGRTFSGLTTFDAHLRLLKVEPWVECLDPETLKRPLREANGVWRLPSRDNG